MAKVSFEQIVTAPPAMLVFKNAENCIDNNLSVTPSIGVSYADKKRVIQFSAPGTFIIEYDDECCDAVEFEFTETDYGGSEALGADCTAPLFVEPCGSNDLLQLILDAIKDTSKEEQTLLKNIVDVVTEIKVVIEDESDETQAALASIIAKVDQIISDNSAGIDEIKDVVEELILAVEANGVSLENIDGSLADILAEIESQMRVDFEVLPFCVLDSSGASVPNKIIKLEKKYSNTGALVESKVVVSDITSDGVEAAYPLGAGEVIGPCGSDGLLEDILNAINNTSAAEQVLLGDIVKAVDEVGVLLKSESDETQVALSGILAKIQESIDKNSLDLGALSVLIEELITESLEQGLSLDEINSDLDNILSELKAQVRVDFEWLPLCVLDGDGVKVPNTLVRSERRYTSTGALSSSVIQPVILGDDGAESDYVLLSTDKIGECPQQQNCIVTTDEECFVDAEGVYVRTKAYRKIDCDLNIVDKKSIVTDIGMCSSYSLGEEIDTTTLKPACCIEGLQMPEDVNPTKATVLGAKEATDLSVKVTYSGGPLLVDWGDGTIDTLSSGVSYRHNHTSPFTGDIKIVSYICDPVSISSLELHSNSNDSWFFDIARLEELDIKESILIGGNSVFGDIGNLSKDMTGSVSIYGTNTISGDVSTLPQGLTGRIYITGHNTISGDVSGFPQELTDLIIIAGQNTISGDVSGLPQMLTDRVYVAGQNTLSGDISGMPQGLTHSIYVTGQNTISGDISGTPQGLTVVFSVHGYNTITGDISGAPQGVKEQFMLYGNNTVSGDVSGLPSDIGQYLRVYGQNTLSGDVSGLPRGITKEITIAGNNTLTGDVSGFPRNISKRLLINGENTISGDVSGLPQGITDSLLIHGENTISGDIAGSPQGLTDGFYIGGQTTLSGDISGAPQGLKVELVVLGANTISGDVSGIPRDLVKRASIYGYNTISGDVSDFPSNLKEATIAGRSTIASASPFWSTEMDYLKLTGTTATQQTFDNLLQGALDSGESNNSLILNYSTLSATDSTIVGQLQSRGWEVVGFS